MCLGMLSEIGMKRNREEFTQQTQAHLEVTNNNSENYKKIATFIIFNDCWSTENGMVTPTIKIKRTKIDEKYKENYKKWHDETKAVI